MAKHLGRNPFGKSDQPNRAKEPKKKAHESTTTDNQPAARSPISEPVKWFLVDLPADTITFAIKTAGLVKSILKK